ncbi:hypothetical protein LA080_005392 [Diaporthe eres]|nr:hypothetical protein LA080_005392 [Diaporthe eres]
MSILNASFNLHKKGHHIKGPLLPLSRWGLYLIHYDESRKQNRFTASPVAQRHHSVVVDQPGVAMRIDAASSSGSLGNAPNKPLVVGQHGKHTDDDLQKLDERHFSGRLTLLIITFSERFPRTTTWLKLRQVANIK